MTTSYADKTDLFPMEGGCPCGFIRYSLSLSPLIVHCCHCTDCQRQTGTAFALNAVIESSALALLPRPAPAAPGSPSTAKPGATGYLPSFARSMAATPTTEMWPATTNTEAVCVPTESHIGQTFVQCPACHSTLWCHYGDAGPHISYLRVGTLDRAREVGPDVHIYTRSRAQFFQIQDGKPQFEEYYPDRMELLRPTARERFLKLMDVVKGWKAEVYGSI